MARWPGWRWRGSRADGRVEEHLLEVIEFTFECDDIQRLVLRYERILDLLRHTRMTEEPLVGCLWCIVTAREFTA